MTLHIILASNSPRRKELLAGMGFEFHVMPSEIDEKALCDPTLEPEAYVIALAEAKGLSVAEKYPLSLVISADTVVVLNGQYLEKPLDKADAKAMLTKTQGTLHQVYTGIGVFYQGKICLEALATSVRMAAMSEDEISAYIETGEPMDKAGSYAIQGIGGQFVEHIDGCYSNVVGLSLPLLKTLLAKLNIPTLPSSSQI